MRIHTNDDNLDVWEKTWDFYLSEIKNNEKLPPEGKHCFTVFLRKSDNEGDTDGFREFNRVTNVYYREIKSNYIIAMIQTVPIDNFLKVEKLISHLTSN